MTSPPDIWALFDQALDLADAERRELLSRVGASRPELAAELAAMLEASGDDAALAIEDKLLGAGVVDEAGPAAGTLAGPYRLVRRIGRGGMGDVYLAERADGSFRQRVAIKLMRPGIASAEMVERFRLEREVLARLTHPAVVPLLDGGTTADGQPYLALQYVDGLPITDHCDRLDLDASARLALFVVLCRAVQFAHANLVVHRDLKPSNILVTAEGEIRLLDFGVAKLLGSEAPGEITTTVQAPLTPRRAAPEQRTGAGVTTATDVWALGVLLHELLTGSLPEVEDGAAVRVDRGGVEPGLPRDLAAIVAMAMAPEPARRYPSAGHLADDVERHLDNLPVLARPDAWAYRFGRLLRRHRVASAVVAVSALFLTVLAIVSAVQAVRISRTAAVAAAQERQANAVVDLLVELFGGANPYEGAEIDAIDLGDLIDRGEAHAARLAREPIVQARLRGVLGKILVERGDHERGRALLETALASHRRLLAPEDPIAVRTALDLARALHLGGDVEAARELAASAVGALEAGHDIDPNLLALALQTLGGLSPTAEGEAMIARAIAMRRGLPDADPVAQGIGLVTLATHRQIRGDGPGARGLFEEALSLLAPALGQDHPQVLSVRSNLAVYVTDPRERAGVNREILDLRLAQLGPDHLLVANSWLGLGEALLAAGEAESAVEPLREAWRIWASSAPIATRTVRAGRALAGALTEVGRHQEARRLIAAMIDAHWEAGRETPPDLLFTAAETAIAAGEIEAAQRAAVALRARPDLGAADRESLARLDRALAAPKR